MLVTFLNKQKYDFDHASFKRSQDWFQPNFKSNQRFFSVNAYIKELLADSITFGTEKKKLFAF